MIPTEKVREKNLKNRIRTQKSIYNSKSKLTNDSKERKPKLDLVYVKGHLLSAQFRPIYAYRTSLAL